MLRRDQLVTIGDKVGKEKKPMWNESETKREGWSWMDYCDMDESCGIIADGSPFTL